jgi:hypothetical protein
MAARAIAALPDGLKLQARWAGQLALNIRSEVHDRRNKEIGLASISRASKEHAIKIAYWCAINMAH